MEWRCEVDSKVLSGAFLKRVELLLGAWGC